MFCTKSLGQSLKHDLRDIFGISLKMLRQAYLHFLRTATLHTHLRFSYPSQFPSQLPLFHVRLTTDPG